MQLHIFVYNNYLSRVTCSEVKAGCTLEQYDQTRVIILQQKCSFCKCDSRILRLGTTLYGKDVIIAVTHHNYPVLHSAQRQSDWYMCLSKRLHNYISSNRMLMHLGHSWHLHDAEYAWCMWDTKISVQAKQTLSWTATALTAIETVAIHVQASIVGNIPENFFE